MTLAPPRIHNLLHHLQSKQKAEGDEASHCEKAKICLSVCLSTFVSLAHATFSLLLFALINCVSCDISGWALRGGGQRERREGVGGKRRREEPEGGGEIKSKLRGVCFTLFLHRATALRVTTASVHLLTITATDLKRR